MCEFKLYNQNCLDFVKTIPDNSIDLVVTDPPYILRTDGAGFFGKKSDNSGKGKGKYGGERYVMKDIDCMSNGFDNMILDEICRIMKKINCYFFCSQKQIMPLYKYFVEEKKCNWNIISWHKSNPIPACGNKYLSDTEFIMFFREKGVKVYGSYDTKRTYYVTNLNTKDKKEFGHPTIKPLQIVENLVVNSSLEGDLVLDPYMGSGTTGVACKKHNRNFIGIEINEEYYNIAKRRISEENNF